MTQAAADGLDAPVLEVPMLGGSFPIYIFGDIIKAPVVLMPVVNDDNSRHGSDESIRLQNLWDGIQIFSALFARLGQDWR